MPQEMAEATNFPYFEDNTLRDWAIPTPDISVDLHRTFFFKMVRASILINSNDGQINDWCHILSRYFLQENLRLFEVEEEGRWRTFFFVNHSSRFAALHRWHSETGLANVWKTTERGKILFCFVAIIVYNRTNARIS